MKILFLLRHIPEWYCSWASFFEALASHPYVKCLGPGSTFAESYPHYDELKEGTPKYYIDVPKAIKKLYPNDYPDVVMQPSTTTVSWIFPRLRGFERAKCLRVMWTSDFHNDVGKGRVYNFIKDGNIDVIFKAYDVNNESEWSQKLLETDVSIEWSPFSIDPSVFYDRDLPKIFDVLNLGQATTQNYPFRYKIHQLLKDQSRIKYYVRSKSKIIFDDDAKMFKEDNNLPRDLTGAGHPYYGHKYAAIINQSRIFTTDCSTYNFAVQKMFETMACNTLLMCNKPRSAKELGFKNKVNYVDWEHEPKQSSDVNDKKVMELINYYLENPDETSKIARRGYDLVHSKHTHEVRMKELFTTLEKYL